MSHIFIGQKKQANRNREKHIFCDFLWSRTSRSENHFLPFPFIHHKQTFFYRKSFSFLSGMMKKEKDRKRKKEIKKVFLPPFIYFGYVTELAWLWHWFWWIEDAVTLQCFPFHFVLHNSWGWVVSWEMARQLIVYYVTYTT